MILNFVILFNSFDVKHANKYISRDLEATLNFPRDKYFSLNVNKTNFMLFGHVSNDVRDNYRLF